MRMLLLPWNLIFLVTNNCEKFLSLSWNENHFLDDRGMEAGGQQIVLSQESVGPNNCLTLCDFPGNKPHRTDLSRSQSRPVYPKLHQHSCSTPNCDKVINPTWYQKRGVWAGEIEPCQRPSCNWQFASPLLQQQLPGIASLTVQPFTWLIRGGEANADSQQLWEEIVLSLAMSPLRWVAMLVCL